ncbi:glutamate synthase-related protein [Veronia pacifica]|uniref:Glutamate synthase large subunit n=1 Tax=Veronia pacifica TaxID=1080227 RepID=A0A1C3EPM5_9GAMM|nr:glutamate synthase-related protein [Veronia pacifica]ODA35214.1 glutamate synthase large subunit [Veronia pacifica]
MKRYLFDRNSEHSSCGVGFITHKHSKQTHTLLKHAHQGLCMIPHRGGISADGTGDGAGVNIDISLNFFRKLTKKPSLKLGEFGVANFFYPVDKNQHKIAHQIIVDTLKKYELNVLLWRDVPVNNDVLNKCSAAAQLPIKQCVFAKPKSVRNRASFEHIINLALLDIEQPAFTHPELEGLYPLSMSSHTQVLKNRLNSWEVVAYFCDLTDTSHKIHTLFFHTRFSTNTAPNPVFAQPFRRMAHNGELNTDRKNRLSEAAIARLHNKKVIFPKGQSDSARLDQTLARRVTEDEMDIDVAALAMMPPAWENDHEMPDNVRDMLEYFSLYEEKNDGPAAFIFGDGVKIGARLDRLGLRPLRTVETSDYLAVMSEAGQIDFPHDEVIRRGRIEAGGMVVFNHETKETLYTNQILERLAAEKDYSAILSEARILLSDLPDADVSQFDNSSSLEPAARHVAYSMNQESFKFMLDPMLQTGMEKISAMGYGLTPNALSGIEGGVSKYFSQRFAQVTNPPLDSIREADGMTLRVALGPKPNISPTTNVQLVIPSPILQPQQMVQILEQDKLKIGHIDTLFIPDLKAAKGDETNVKRLQRALDDVADQAEKLASSQHDIIVLTDQHVSHKKAALPAMLVIAAVNQRLIDKGLRFSTSIIYQTGQASSTHDIASLLGFGASAVCPVTVFNRAWELYGNIEGVKTALKTYQKAVEKALMKTMGKFGLCTAESYIGGEFFEANFLDTQDPPLAALFPNIHSPVGGAQFADLVESAIEWHQKVFEIQAENQIPVLGLFKERAEGGAHGYGNLTTREFVALTEEPIQYAAEDASEWDESGFLLPEDEGYKDLGFEARTPEQIDSFAMTEVYREFTERIYEERKQRPATLRDVLALPVDLSQCKTEDDFVATLSGISFRGSPQVSLAGLSVESVGGDKWLLQLHEQPRARHPMLAFALQQVFGSDLVGVDVGTRGIQLNAHGTAKTFFTHTSPPPNSISLDDVQPAHQITAAFASGAMSHGALVARAHEAVAHGTNIAGAMSNSGEGGENSRRYNSVKASRIKQFASGRFGVWTGYLADPSLEEIEIKIAQGAKPGEGGQLPSPKVNVEIAAARGGTPGVELVSPPPHHDTYSIEDLGQLIHDAKAARVRVIVKLVSSEGIGTIAVGVAKAGADVINVAGNTGGTGAAQVTSLKNTGRAADIGIAEVHQALAENGLRDKVTLRCSNAHQTGIDVVKSAILGGDSFEFGTTALMMLKCVMAKNCNLKCPAGLTTNPELYRGDPRALAQYFMNVAHEVRHILASLGYTSLEAICGQTHLLHLINHPEMIGQLDMTGLLAKANTKHIEDPICLEACFKPDDGFIETVEDRFFSTNNETIQFEGPSLCNCNKTVGGQFSIDIERILNYRLTDKDASQHPAVHTLENGRRILTSDSVEIITRDSAGQSFAAFNNSGVTMRHIGTCNDGVGKGASGGRIIVQFPGGQSISQGDNVLIGNFALFGATGGELFVEGEAGDRFGVRNSGAVAVVEGVGDFCCEYMTNGAVINLGGYGKGFGNGMSGGTAFQYDPSGAIVSSCSNDSVKAISLKGGDSLVEGQRQALHYHLTQHFNATGSDKARAILHNWALASADFYVLIPLSLFKYHTSDAISAAMDRKSMVEELSQYFSRLHISRIKEAYANHEAQGISIFDGKVPRYGDRDTDLICQYVNASGVLRRGLETARQADEFLKRGATETQACRYLFDTEDKRLIDVLVKDAKAALADYDDAALACLIAQKRVDDYKSAMSKREVWDSRAWGTSVWIIERDREIRQQLEQYPAFEQLLASHYCHVLSQVMRDAA